MDKEALRKQAQSLRDIISDDVRIQAGRKIAELFFEQQHDQGFKIVAGYMPIRGEINPRGLLSKLQQQGVRCALPALAKDRLCFRAYEQEDRLVKGAYGILQPRLEQEELTPDLILVPLLAFDRHGMRLGYGAGHYDRALVKVTALKLGLAFAVQEVDHLPRKPHDICLDGVLTEKAWHII